MTLVCSNFVVEEGSSFSLASTLESSPPESLELSPLLQGANAVLLMRIRFKSGQPCPPTLVLVIAKAPCASFQSLSGVASLLFFTAY